jgi:alkaline phosphatase D
MLGDAQERWLSAGLDRSPARWNVIGQQTLMAQLDRKPGPGQQFWTDGWDGYPAPRRRLLDFLGQRKPANPIVIGGDVHSFWVADLKPDFDDPRSPVVASEFVGTSIVTVQDPPGKRRRAAARQPAHPTRKWLSARYVRIEITPQRARIFVVHGAERHAAGRRGRHAGHLRSRGRTARRGPRVVPDGPHGTIGVL